METGINLLGEWKTSEKEIIQKIVILQSGINAETVHDIRVAIKKLRAYCVLSNHLEGSAKNELPQTKLLFDVLGKHREWDMVLEYLKKSPDDQGELCPSFVAHIHQAKDEIVHLIKNALDEYNVNELEEAGNRLQELINVMTLQKVAGNCRNIINEQIRKLKKRSAFFKKEPHYIRKLLKTILYWINLFPPETLYPTKQMKHLDVFLDKIGKWHDFEIILVKVKNYRKNYLAKSIDEYRILKNLEKDLKGRSNKLFDKLKPQVILNELKN